MDNVILVTGANGFVGRNLINFLVNRPKTNIVAVDVHENFIPLNENLHAGIEYHKGDLSSRPCIEKLSLMYRFDTIIHLAAIISQASDTNTYFAIMNSNIQATFLLLEMAQEHKARIVFPSTALVYGSQKGPFTEAMQTDPGDFYALSKLMSEQLIRFYGNRYALSWVIFRIGILYGAGQTNAMFIPTLVSSLLDGKEFPMTKGEQTRDFIYIDDLVNAIEIVLDQPEISGLFNLGTGHAPMLRDVAVMVEKLVGEENKVRPGAIPYRDKESWEYCVDGTKAKKILNWQPSTSLDAGINKTIDFERKRRVAVCEP